MKLRNLVLILAGSLVALLLLAVVLAFTPGVQTWAVRRALSGMLEGQLAIDRVAVGLSSTEITGLKLVQPDFSARLARLSVRYSAMDLLRSRTVDLAELLIEGVELDLRQKAGGGATPSETPAAAPSGSGAPIPEVQESDDPAPAFRGILEAARLPDGFRVARLRLDGIVRVAETQSGSFELSGEGVAAASQAGLAWTVELTDRSPEAAVRTVRAGGEATATLAADGRMERVAGNVVAAVDGDDLPADRFRLDFALSRSVAGNEDYELDVARVAAAGEDPLFAARGTFEAGSSNLAGTWRATLAGPSVAAVLSGLKLPELSLDGEGTFGWNARAGTFAATGRAQGQLAQLATWSPALETVGAVRFRTNFEIAGEPETVRLARFDLDVATPEGTQLAQMETLQAVTLTWATQALGFANPGADLARVALRSVPLAWAQPWVAPLRIESGELSLTLAVTAATDGSRVGLSGTNPLEIRNLTVRNEATTLAENVTVDVYPIINYDAGHLRAELSRLSVSLGAGDSVTGALQVEVADALSRPAVAFSGELAGRLVSVHTPHVPVETGPLGFATSFAGTHAENVLELTRGAVTARGDADTLLAEVTLHSPVQLNVDTGEMTGTPALSAGVQLGTVPLSWANSFLEDVTLVGDVTGGTIELVMVSTTEMTVNTVAPLTLRGAGLTKGDEVMARELDLSVDASATLKGDNLTYDVRQFSAGQGDSSLANVKAAGDVTLGEETLRLTARGTLEADAAAALRQPVLAPYATLARGRMGATFEATLGEGMEARAAVMLRQLVARAENKALGDVDATLSLTTRRDGSGAVNLPLKVVAGNRSSDVLVKGDFTQGEKGITFNGAVTGTRVNVDDLQAFAVLAPATTPAPAPTTRAPGGSTGTRPSTPPVVPDTQPFWSGVGGRLQADLKTVHYGADTVINDLKGVVALSETRIALETFEGRMKEDPFKFTGGINFDARQPRPYTLSGTVNLSNLDLGAILAAANPGSKPAVETKLSAVGNLSGQGATLNDLLSRAQGTFDVKGSSGVLRALGRRGEAVGVVSGLLGLAGALSGSGSTVATAELASQLNELRFDSVTMKIERGADLNIRLASLEFISPTSRVTGTGGITFQEGVPLTRQPLRLQLSLAGKGALAQVLNRAGLLTGQQDDREYYTLSRAFSISGTPLSPDSGDLWRFVTEAAIRAATTRRSAPAEGQGTQGTPQSQGTPLR